MKKPSHSGLVPEVSIEEPLVYRFPDIQRMLGGMSRTEVYRLIAAGELVTFKMGRHRVASRDALQAVIQNARKKAA